MNCNRDFEPTILIGFQLISRHMNPFRPAPKVAPTKPERLKLLENEAIFDPHVLLVLRATGSIAPSFRIVMARLGTLMTFVNKAKESTTILSNPPSYGD